MNPIEEAEKKANFLAMILKIYITKIRLEEFIKVYKALTSKKGKIKWI